MNKRFKTNTSFRSKILGDFNNLLKLYKQIFNYDDFVTIFIFSLF